MSGEFYRKLAQDAEAVARVARAAMASPPGPEKLAEPGNVFVMADSVESGICWVVASAEDQVVQLVPADAFPVSGVHDVRTELDEPLGALILRPAQAVLIDADELTRARFIGTVPTAYATVIQQRVAEASASKLAEKDPDLREWLPRVQKVASALTGRQPPHVRQFSQALKLDVAGWVRSPLKNPVNDGIALRWPQVTLRLPGATLTFSGGVTRLPGGDTRFLMRVESEFTLAVDSIDLALEDQNGTGVAAGIVGDDLERGVAVRFTRTQPTSIAGIRARIRRVGHVESAEVEKMIDALEGLVRGHGCSITDARKKLCGIGVPEEQARAAQAEFERRAAFVRNSREPLTLHTDDLLTWYSGPGESDVFWPALKRLLRAKPAWDDARIATLDQASTKVLSLLPPPAQVQFKAKGLVVGYVQSGKTANYSALIAKAADAGYKFFIVLAGMHNNLRNQTQGRLYSELGALNTSHWMILTNKDEDFRANNHNVNSILGRVGAQKVLCVVKKNAAVLRRLMTWLKSADSLTLAGCPVLVIDDEADQASINAASAARRTAINQLVMNMLRTLPKCAYVGYTATPFANVFVDPAYPDDLYPRDFIVDLPRPPNYFGAERLFGREPLNLDAPDASFDGIDMIRSVPEAEGRQLVPVGRDAHRTFAPELTATLQAAVRYFWMATAAREARGQASDHSSMLVHTTLYTQVQERLAPLVEGYRDEIAELVQRNDPAILAQLEGEWQQEIAKVPAAELDQTATTFAELLVHLGNTLSQCEIVVENSRQDIRLAYPENERQVVIVIGGNTLSRGLTLEGLLVSFFVRNANAYDTLLQMGRWFGYREGYRDLPRIWMTDELRSYFFDLATVEQEIRNDIRRYDAEGLTPLEFAVRVRTHPALAITNKLKMQAAKQCQVSLSGQRIQTILFNHRDDNWLERNMLAAVSLIDGAVGQGIRAERDRHYVRFADVPAETVLAFLEQYQIHEAAEHRTSTIRDYIHRQNALGELQRWTVCVVGNSLQRTRTISLQNGVEVSLLTRSKLHGTGKDYANVKAIMSPGDSWADGTTKPDGKNTRILDSDEAPMLLLYPIDRVSTPQSDPKTREQLNATRDVIGIGMLFPVAREPTPVSYMTVDLSGVYCEEPELPEDETEAA